MFGDIFVVFLFFRPFIRPSGSFVVLLSIHIYQGKARETTVLEMLPNPFKQVKSESENWYHGGKKLGRALKKLTVIHRVFQKKLYSVTGSCKQHTDWWNRFRFTCNRQWVIRIKRAISIACTRIQILVCRHGPSVWSCALKFPAEYPQYWVIVGVVHKQHTDIGHVS